MHGKVTAISLEAAYDFRDLLEHLFVEESSSLTIFQGVHPKMGSMFVVIGASGDAYPLTGLAAEFPVSDSDLPIHIRDKLA